MYGRFNACARLLNSEQVILRFILFSFGMYEGL